MSYPTVTQTWTMSFNNRSTFQPALALPYVRTMGDFMFSFKNFLKTTMGYTVKGSSNGTTGAMDGVDRITSATAWGTRNNGASGAMSWLVMTDGAGVDWCFSYNIAIDTAVRLAHSTGGNYIAAGTPTFQPTAVDECFDLQTSSWVNANSGARLSDTVWHMWGSADKKIWRVVTATSAGIAIISQSFLAYIAGERFISSVVSPSTFTLTTGGGTVPAVKSYYVGSDGNGGRTFTWTSNINSAYAGTSSMDIVRVHSNGADNNSLATHGGEMPGGGAGASHGNAIPFSSNNPALQGWRGPLMFPSTLGSITTNADGKLGDLIDHWYVLGNNINGPNFLDSYGGLQFWAIVPGVVLVGDGVTRLADR